MIKKCEHCGVEFKARSQKERFCSRPCYFAFYKEKLKAPA